LKTAEGKGGEVKEHGVILTRESRTHGQVIEIQYRNISNSEGQEIFILTSSHFISNRCPKYRSIIKNMKKGRRYLL
jgi:hypothetical protein